jgi:hypothetical protein
MGKLGTRYGRPPGHPVPATESGESIDWRSLTPEHRKARVEERSATRPMHAADWIDARVLMDELFDSSLLALDADAKLRHYARQQPRAILTEAEARAQTPNYDSGRGSIVPDPWTFAGEPQPGWWA